MKNTIKSTGTEDCANHTNPILRGTHGKRQARPLRTVMNCSRLILSVVAWGSLAVGDAWAGTTPSPATPAIKAPAPAVDPKAVPAPKLTTTAAPATKPTTTATTVVQPTVPATQVSVVTKPEVKPVAVANPTTEPVNSRVPVPISVQNANNPQSLPAGAPVISGTGGPISNITIESVRTVAAARLTAPQDSAQTTNPNAPTVPKSGTERIENRLPGMPRGAQNPMGGTNQDHVPSDLLIAAGGNVFDALKNAVAARGLMSDPSLMVGALNGRMVDAANSRVGRNSVADEPNPQTDDRKVLNRIDQWASVLGLIPIPGNPATTYTATRTVDEFFGLSDLSTAIAADAVNGEATKFDMMIIEAKALEAVEQRKAESEKNKAAQQPTTSSVEFPPANLVVKKSSPSSNLPKGCDLKGSNTYEDQPVTAGSIAFGLALTALAGYHPVDPDSGSTQPTNDGIYVVPVDPAKAAGVIGSKSEKSLVGNPGGQGVSGAGPNASNLNSGGSAGGASQGTDVDFQDRSGFTGATRTEDPQNMNVGRSSGPLVGMSGAPGNSGSTGNSSANTPASPVQLAITLPRRLADRSYELTVRGTPGQKHRVEVSGDLRTWKLLGEVANTTGSRVVNDGLAATESRRFYRVSTGSSFAPTVVGFAEVTVPPGYSLVANQFDSANSTVATVFGDVPTGTMLGKYEPTTGDFTANVYNGRATGWQTPTQPFGLGKVAMLFNPEKSAFVVTFEGEVAVGPSTLRLPAGDSISGSFLPLSGRLQADLGFPAAAGDEVHIYRNGHFVTSKVDPITATWDVEPVLNVGEAFFVKKAATADWTRDFSVTE